MGEVGHSTPVAAMTDAPKGWQCVNSWYQAQHASMLVNFRRHTRKLGKMGQPVPGEAPECGSDLRGCGKPKSRLEIARNPDRVSVRGQHRSGGVEGHAKHGRNLLGAAALMCKPSSRYENTGPLRCWSCSSEISSDAARSKSSGYAGEPVEVERPAESGSTKRV